MAIVVIVLYILLMVVGVAGMIYWMVWDSKTRREIREMQAKIDEAWRQQ